MYLYNITIPFLLEKPSIENESEKSLRFNLIANHAFSILQSIFVKAVQNVLYNHFKINEIKVPKDIFHQIKNEYDFFITTNYDDNFPFPYLIKLHGGFDKKITDDATFEKLFTRENINDFLAQSTLSEEEIVSWGVWYRLNSEGNSRIIFSGKSANKRNYDSIKSDPEKWTLMESLTSSFNEVDLDKFQVDSEYKKLKYISGEVDIVGLSTKNDEFIFDELLNNPYIVKINNYEDNYVEFWNKYYIDKKI